jgi:secretion/DNA translocation related TadE-like protein
VRGDDGVATVLAATMVLALVALAVAGVALGSAVAARHRAQAAADLAALGAAGRLALGRDTACGEAESVAAEMRTAVTACRVEGLDVIVTVEATARLGRWGVGVARGMARAGPVES